MSNANTGLRIDLGCGAIKKQDTVGLDITPAPAVDIVTNIETSPLPFPDRSVAYVHSSHFLEHTRNPGRVFEEVSRVAVDNARLEFWTPYVWHGSAFVLGHDRFFAEEIYLHICVKFYDYWSKALKARWVLHELQYVIDPQTLVYLRRHKIGLDFAVRHLHDVVYEIGAHMSVRREDRGIAPPVYRRTFSTGRFAPRYEIKADKSAVASQSEIERAIHDFAQGGALPSDLNTALK